MIAWDIAYLEFCYNNLATYHARSPPLSRFPYDPGLLYVGTCPSLAPKRR